MTVPAAAGGASAEDGKVALTVEVCVRPECGADLHAVEAAARAYLAALPSVRYAEGPLEPPLPGQHPLLDAAVQGLAVADLGGAAPPGKLLLPWDVSWQARCGRELPRAAAAGCRC